jgi:hypothetical protein
MGQKHTDSLCHACDIKCSLPLTANEKNRLSTVPPNNANHPDYHASCRMALLNAYWRKIIQDGIKARTSHESELAARCKQVLGKYCTWGSGWSK